MQFNQSETAFTPPSFETNCHKFAIFLLIILPIKIYIAYYSTILNISHVLFPREVDYQSGMDSLKSTTVGDTVVLMAIDWLS